MTSNSFSRRTLLAGGLAAVGAAVAACGGGARQGAAAPRSSATAPSPTASATPTLSPPPDPASVHANELGVIPVLMHHRLTDKVDSEFDMTPAWFRAELARLHAEGYYPVTMLQVATRDLGHVPAGRSPVVLTFDDSSRGQLHYSAAAASGTADGADVAADSAVGILRDYAREHPDFPAVASFYLNKDPFALGDPHRAIGTLASLGHEVGNHTFDHVPLRIPAAQIQRQIGELAAMVSTADPALAARTLALPLGVTPAVPALARSGRWGTTRYRNEAILLVGSEPAHSPWHHSWNAGAVPRIRSSSYGGGKGEFLSTWWLDQIKGGTVTRYVSAGNPGHVTVPKKYADRLAPAYRSLAVTY